MEYLFNRIFPIAAHECAPVNQVFSDKHLVVFGGIQAAEHEHTALMGDGAKVLALTPLVTVNLDLTPVGTVIAEPDVTVLLMVVVFTNEQYELVAKCHNLVQATLLIPGAIAQIDDIPAR